jgi:TonB family protein
MRLLLSLLSLGLATIPTSLRGQQSAFVSCVRREKHATAFANVCDKSSTVHLNCGQQVQVLENRGDWLKIRTAGGDHYFIGFSALSYDRKRFLPVSLPDLGAVECLGDSERHRGPVPKPIYTPDPEYSEEARGAKLEGDVRLAVTVATDGTVHDVKVVKSLGKGLDEKAVAAVREWRFEPLIENGKPIESTLQITVTFRLY